MKKNPFENNVEKRENADLPAFSPFPIMYSALSKRNFKFSATFILSSANAFNFDLSKCLLCGKD